jgi:putative transferase (TIGR04331 family)
MEEAASVTGRFLITTADESTWRTDVPVLFLGEWCKLFARRAVWEKMDAVVAPYHWDDRDKFQRDYCYLQATYEELLPDVAAALNALHGVDHSTRYWRILVGPWVGYFLQILFDRWAMIEQVSGQFEINGVRLLETSREHIVPNDMQEFVRLMVDDPWNEAIYADVVRRRAGISIENVPEDFRRWTMAGTNNVVVAKVPTHRKILRRVAGVATSASQRLGRSTDAFVMATSLPMWSELRLQAQLGQVPTVWRSEAPRRVALRASVRAWTLHEASGDEFTAIARQMLPVHMPRVYLEGYTSLQEQVQALPWPRSPQVIFSSTSFSADDVFKAWAGGKAEAGTPLVIAQHGGGYGSSREISNEDHEVRIADKYLTWGWDDARRTNVHPMFCTKTTGTTNRAATGRATILLVTVCYPRQSYKLTSESLASQWLDYFDDQCAFVKALPEAIRGALIARLYNEDFGWSQQQRWRESCPGIQLDEGARPFAAMIRESRLVVATYNSTTFLETLTQNVPTIVYWNPRRWELRDDAVPYFASLKHAGILHETPSAAAARIAEIWDDVPAWWNHPETQRAREHFGWRFARSSTQPVAALAKSLFRISR